MYGRGKKLSKPKTENIRNCFILKKKKKEIKDRVTRNIQINFQTVEEKKENKNQREKKKLITD